MKERERMNQFCDEFIGVGDDYWAGTYCKLRAGHEGAHSAHYPVETFTPVASLPPEVQKAAAAMFDAAGAHLDALASAEDR